MSVKYADCPSTEVQTYIAAPPEQVWPWVIDLEAPARFTSELQGATWVDEKAGPHLGARFIGRNRHPVVGEWQTTCLVVGYQPARLFAYVVEDPDWPTATWRFELEPDGEGTLLRQYARIGPGPSNLTPLIEAAPEREESIVARRMTELNSNMTRTIEGIKSLAERAARDPALEV